MPRGIERRRLAASTSYQRDYAKSSQRRSLRRETDQGVAGRLCVPAPATIGMCSERPRSNERAACTEWTTSSKEACTTRHKGPGKEVRVAPPHCHLRHGSGTRRKYDPGRVAWKL